MHILEKTACGLRIRRTYISTGRSLERQSRKIQMVAAEGGAARIRVRVADRMAVAEENSKDAYFAAEYEKYMLTTFLCVCIIAKSDFG